MKCLSLAGLFLLFTAAGCGPGGPNAEADTAADPPDWAYGWWVLGDGVQTDLELSNFVTQMEIRPDGTVTQWIDYCNDPDWTYEGRWELQPDGAVRMLPNPGEELVPFLGAPIGYEYVELRGSEAECEAEVLRKFDETPTHTTVVRGRWCFGEYFPEFDECAMERNCGEDPPVCQ